MIKLDTEDQIAEASVRILELRDTLDAGQALTLDEQREMATIAEAALLRCQPLPPEQRWTNDDRRSSLPAWLMELPESEESHADRT